MSAQVALRLNQLRSRLSDRFLAFKPSIETFAVDGHEIRFFVGTPQAVEWYVPLTPHLRAEFEWIAQRLAGHREAMIDAGAYHGIYALVMGKAAGAGSRLAVVDPVPSNCAIIAANLALNGIEGRIVEAAVSTEDAPVSFSTGSCGRITEGGARSCAGTRLPTIMPEATVAKIDIEGAEAAVLPQQIDAMPRVHTWMVELHPDLGADTKAIIALFVERGYALHRLDRAAAAVVPFAPDDTWDGRSTLIAVRDRDQAGPTAS